MNQTKEQIRDEETNPKVKLLTHWSRWSKNTVFRLYGLVWKITSADTDGIDQKTMKDVIKMNKAEFI